MKYIIRGSIVELFSGYGFIDVGTDKASVQLWFAMLVKLFSLTMTKLLIHGMAWSTGVMMPAVCISANCCLKADCWGQVKA